MLYRIEIGFFQSLSTLSIIFNVIVNSLILLHYLWKCNKNQNFCSLCNLTDFRSTNFICFNFAIFYDRWLNRQKRFKACQLFDMKWVLYKNSFVCTKYIVCLWFRLNMHFEVCTLFKNISFTSADLIRLTLVSNSTWEHLHINMFYLSSLSFALIHIGWMFVQRHSF